ncbi:MAG: DNA repair protein RecO [Treponema sp.]|nr:DNA repair protein RecO [Treponema sp.]
MSRNQSYHALILRSRPSGESNRDVWLISPEAGLLRVTVFGGPKSRLRSYASPFHSGQAWVYHDPVKNTFKLSDFDVSSWRPGLREMYERAMSADAVAETILSSHGGGGNWGRALTIAQAALDALEAADEETCNRIVLWFLWQWTDFLGLRPEFGACSLCGKPSPQRYSIREGGMICDSCSAGEAGPAAGGALVEAGPGCCHWLETTRSLNPDQIVRHTLDKKSFREAKSLATAILAEAIGKRLDSW